MSDSNEILGYKIRTQFVEGKRAQRKRRGEAIIYVKA
jgi:hypothetical protein